MSDSYDDYETAIQLAEHAWEQAVNRRGADRGSHTSKGGHMNREDIIKLAREAGLAYGSDEKPLNSVTRFATLVAATERNKLAAWMMSQGYATGHGDSIEKLLEELEWQIEERIRNEREACASICFQEGPSIDGELIAQAIRARGEK